jgi:hypothetical protein
MHRAGTPEEVAAAVQFLGSENAAYITGQTLTLDGGLTAGWPLFPDAQPAPGRPPARPEMTPHASASESR